MVKEKIIDEIPKKSHEKGKYLGVKGNTLTIYKHRNKIPENTVLVAAVKYDLDLNKIFKD
jgi:hypothetical protein